MADVMPRPEDVLPLPLDQYLLYGYIPTKWICILFVALFGLSTVAHMGQCVHYRLWWAIPTMVACGVAEVVGWSGRLWSSSEPFNLNPYLMQICTTILAPSFLTAGIYTILGIIIRILGERYSWLRPNWYLFIFVTLDLAALIIQAVGGGGAAVAVQAGRDPEPGGRIMMWGIITQLIGMTLFCILQAEFLIRVALDRPARAPSEAEDVAKPVISRNIKLTLFAMGFSTIWIFIRSVYRTIELAEGWTGRIIHTQHLFNTLDGMPIVFAMIIFNVLYPGHLLREDAVTLGDKNSSLATTSEKKSEVV